jgi:hypothetical protein
MGVASFGWPGPVAAAGQEQFRKLAPGVLRTIPPSFEPADTHSMHDVVEIHTRPDVKWQSNYTAPTRMLYDMSAETRFQRAIWCLEFSFKPLRMIHVDVPQPSGKMQRKLVWYLVYRVKNTGQQLVPSAKDPLVITLEKTDQAVRFQPSFVLQCYEYPKAYLDRLIPVAIGPIQRREDPNRPLLNSVQMAAQDIPVSSDRVDRSVWGVATWEDIDPRIDFFSIFVQGLTNAYRWVDPPGVYRPGDPPGKGRQFTYKTLQLDFWRPGDKYNLSEREIHFGTPEGEAKKYGVDEGVDYVWVYR